MSRPTFETSRLSDSSDEGSAEEAAPPKKRRTMAPAAENLRDSFSSDYNPRETHAADLHRRESQSSEYNYHSSRSSDTEQPGWEARRSSQSSADNGRRESQSTEDSFQLSEEEGAGGGRPEARGGASGYVDNKAKKMMERMGYKAGRGLGKHAQGRVDPIEASKQRGRRGLGLHIKGLEAATLKWDSSLEVVSVEEKVSWLAEADHETVTRSDLADWMSEGPKKLSLDDETNFCDPDLLRNVLSSKSVFDELEPDEMRKAVAKSNPFETIRGGIFLNRAAMKMANMDKVFDFMFTQPVDQSGDKLVGPNDLLYFADVCAGPGGFSEYVLWRRKWRAKGFGFTLKGENDFRLADFFAGPCETFQPFYGVGGAEGNGNVFDPENVSALTAHVMEQTDGAGVHFMMADGGFSVEGQENIQEILSKQLYLCQFLVSLSVVRTGGSMVCKVFDLFTPFSASLFYLMYRSFHRVSIHKPNTSRPANSERYLVCQWKRDDCEDIRNYMYRVNKQLWKQSASSTKDVTSLVPMSVMTADEAFVNYLVTSNNSIGECQVVNLVKIAAYCRDVTLHEPHQAEMRRQCLQYWEVPDRARTAPPRSAPDAKCQELLRKKIGQLSDREQVLGPDSLDAAFKSVYDWHCCVLGSTRDRVNATFYLSLGRSRVYRLDGARWTKEEALVEMSADTLVYAEMAQELRGEARSQRRINALHLIDGVVLGGVDISEMHLTDRVAQLQLFASALNKPSRTDMTPIRVKRLYDVERVGDAFDALELRAIKGAGRLPRLVYDIDGDRFMLPGGLLFLNATQEPWVRCLSSSTGHKYYYHKTTRTSKYERDRPTEACATAMDSYSRRRVWWWGEGVKVHPLHEEGEGDKLQRDQLEAFVDAKTGRR